MGLVQSTHSAGRFAESEWLCPSLERHLEGSPTVEDECVAWACNE